MTPNPILKALSSLLTNGVRFMLIGGQACVFYGAAEFTRDLDLLLFVDGENTDRLMAALKELQCHPIAVPDFDAKLLKRGHAVHYRCEAPGVESLRIDLMACLRSGDTFEDLWARRTTIAGTDGSLHMLSIEDLVRAKKTQRDKDWPMLARLVSADYFAHADAPEPWQIGFWLREARTTDILMEIAARFPSEAALLADSRPALAAAICGDEDATRQALFDEEQAERKADKAYWEPLKRELEQMRHAKLRAAGN